MNEIFPRISVIMGVYFRRSDIALLKRSVSSILNQTYASFELLICDDGSTPEASAYLDEAACRDERIRLIRRENLITLPSKLNACLSDSKGALIARMDDDDYACPERFEKQITYLDTHPEFAFVGCNVNLIRKGINVGKRILPEYPSVEDFYMTQPYIHPTLMFRRTALERVNGYSERPHQILCEDYDLLLRLYEKGFRGVNLQEFLFDYTIPETHRSNRKMRHRWNETVTRFQRFHALEKLPGAFPYVIKPVIVGLLPGKILERIKGR